MKTLLTLTVGGVIGIFAALLGVTYLIIAEIDNARIPFLDAYYERKEAKANREWNEKLIETHKTIYGEEPVIDWKE